MLTVNDAKVKLQAYLFVLGEQEFASYSKDVLGCLMHLQDFLDERVESKGEGCEEEGLSLLIKAREQINGKKETGDPELVSATSKTVKALKAYLNTM